MRKKRMFFGEEVISVTLGAQASCLLTLGEQASCLLTLGEQASCLLTPGAQASCLLGQSQQAGSLLSQWATDTLTDSYSLCRMRSTTLLTDVALTQSQVQMALF